MRESFFIRSFPHRAKTPRPQRKIFSYFSELGVLCAFARVILHPIFSSSRQDAKTAKKNSFLFLRTWRPLRLCGSPRGIPTRPRSSCSPEALFHRARPVEYLIDRKYIGFAVKLFHRASHRLSDSLNPNSTENFKYVWLGLLGHQGRIEFGLWINQCYRFGAKRGLRTADRGAVAANWTIPSIVI